MARRLFGTDGIRGHANAEPMTAETALRLGRAIAHSARKHNADRGRILVGRDTRISGHMLEMALCSGVCSAGADALTVGIMPTPAIAFLTADTGCAAGAVISASHNPYQDNGIKFFGPDGFKLTDGQEEELEDLLTDSGRNISLSVDRIGKVSTAEDSLGRYVVFAKTSLPRGLRFDGLKVVLDCANGAACKAAPAAVGELGAKVIPLNIDPDGYNINEGCGSLNPAVIREQVIASAANIGIALDGDGDRAIFSDEKGNEVDGDQIMGLVARHMIRSGKLNGNTVVATVMSNIGLEIAVNEMGGSLIRTPVGDRYVVERMRAEGFNFGGEQSGHLVFLDLSTSGDGMLSALQVMRIMVETGKPLSELAAGVQKFPQLMRNVEVRQKTDLDQLPAVRAAIEQGNERLKGRGRLLVRYSGTQSVCRVMAEGDDESLVKELVDSVADAISKNVV